MADNLTPEQRRRNMQHIRSKDTKPEILLRKALWRKGYRYRKNWKALPGKSSAPPAKIAMSFFTARILT